MKQRSTTPVSSFITAKGIIFGVIALAVVVAPMNISQKANADNYDAQINAIQSEIDQYQSASDKYAKEAKSFEAAKAKLSAERQVILGKLRLSKAKHAQLKKEIKKSEEKIEENRDALGEIIASMYLDDNISPLEMLASSSNIGDYVDKQEYRTSVRDNLTDTIDNIKKLKEELESDKADVEKIIAQEDSQRQALAAKESEQAALAKASRSKEASYNKLASDSQAKLQSVAAEQRAYYERLQAQQGGGVVSSGVVGAFQFRNWSGNMGCSGGYPSKWCGTPDTVVDEWQLWNRECVSYAAWKIEYGYGKQVNGFNGQGNADDWLFSANAYSGAWEVSNPQPGDAVVLPKSYPFAPIGHLMVVEQNLGGGWVRVSQYNFFGGHQYSTMDVHSSGVVFLRFPSK